MIVTMEPSNFRLTPEFFDAATAAIKAHDFHDPPPGCKCKACKRVMAARVCASKEA